MTNPEGETSTAIMDAMGRTIITIDAEGDTVRTIYDATSGGLVVTTRIVDPNYTGYTTGLNLTTRVRTDAAGNVRESVDEDENESTVTYDAVTGLRASFGSERQPHTLPPFMHSCA